MSGFARLSELDRREHVFEVDGGAVRGLEGDTLRVAMRLNGPSRRHSEFGDGMRAGFCLMGACQDCWVSTSSGERLRACSMPLRKGLRTVTSREGW